MAALARLSPALVDLLEDREGVIDTASVLRYLTEDQIQWRVLSGRWQRPCRGVIVAHSGSLTERQTLRVAVLSAGPGSALAGLTAARLDGFIGFGDKTSYRDRTIQLLAPPGRRRRAEQPSGLLLAVRYSRLLSDLDVHPVREPRRTRIARSLVDAAAWMPTDRGAMAVLAAGVQQGKARVADLRRVLDRVETVRRHRLMYEVLGDIEGGAQALSELDFTHKVVRRFRLPEPSRQVGRRDSRNRQRWIDVMFDQWHVVVEIDGAQHITPLEQWDDMERDNDLEINGYRVLRFPAWLVRHNPEYVARKIIEALRKNGYRG
jgi:very-short-patch-repair endonuclease